MLELSALHCIWRTTLTSLPLIGNLFLLHLTLLAPQAPAPHLYLTLLLVRLRLALGLYLEMPSPVSPSALATRYSPA
ncbi:unnamed protein product [Chondrus crispus]|uniref:Uncharacterized protein n=1 Tax=Chondrus crispus TaxID=2769 RepID=R7Q6L4_CHOCR|nr:unnamed protein product [Chondrus crispus]CDF33674.1 unnamed protein product [Chondrus crispus]|eukprot:XP_005713493.1 unnamed protein product [Chondrus crispus]